MGSHGSIEIRKYLDIEGRPGTNHLFLADRRGTRHIDPKKRSSAPVVGDYSSAGAGLR
jgi:hypothetical protein